MSIIDNLTKEGYESQHLDSLVHDTASQTASNVNNEGMKGQVEFLLMSGMDEEGILEALRNESE